MTQERAVESFFFSIRILGGFTFVLSLMFFSAVVNAEPNRVLTKSRKVFKVDKNRAVIKMRRLKYPLLPESILSKKVSKTENNSSKNTLLQRQWGLNHIGFFDLYNRQGAMKNSSIESCSPKVVVAVVDTGIDYTHPNLADSIWVNQGEVGKWVPPKNLITSCRNKSCNGIDDDKNGFADDVIGWDFVHDVPLPFDTHGHGTHIAGIISSHPSYGKGVIGVCPRVSIMALKYYDVNVMGYNNLANTVKAFQYAVDNGAQIINYSGGGSDPATAEKNVIKVARSKGVLVVAAAGNNGFNDDHVPYYPASYSLDNVISVASIDQGEKLLSSSNYGKETVDIAAPGLGILSDLPYGRAGTMSGTSQATAFVTGAAALLVSQYKNPRFFDYKKVRKYLLESTRPITTTNPVILMGGGILSVARALRLQAKELPGKKLPIIPTIAVRNLKKGALR